jgi:hypothetical protein
MHSPPARHTVGRADTASSRKRIQRLSRRSPSYRVASGDRSTADPESDNADCISCHILHRYGTSSRCHETSLAFAMTLNPSLDVLILRTIDCVLLTANYDQAICRSKANLCTALLHTWLRRFIPQSTTINRRSSSNLPDEIRVR